MVNPLNARDILSATFMFNLVGGGEKKEVKLSEEIFIY